MIDAGLADVGVIAAARSFRGEKILDGSDGGGSNRDAAAAGRPSAGWGQRGLLGRSRDLDKASRWMAWRLDDPVASDRKVPSRHCSVRSSTRTPCPARTVQHLVREMQTRGWGGHGDGPRRIGIDRLVAGPVLFRAEAPNGIGGYRGAAAFLPCSGDFGQRASPAVSKLTRAGPSSSQADDLTG